MRVLASSKKIRNKISKGFTLIELLVVIAVIAILAVLIIIRVSGVQRDARNTKRIMDMRDIKTAIEMFKATGGRLHPNITAKEIHLARLDDGKGCPGEWFVHSQCLIWETENPGLNDKHPSDYFTSTNYYPVDPQYDGMDNEAGTGIFYEISTDADGNYTITRPTLDPIAPDDPTPEEVPDIHG